MAGQRAEPFAVVAHLGALPVEDLVNLIEVGFRVGAHLLARERRTRFGLARGVANHRREIANEKNSGVAFLLEVLELAQHDRMAEVQIRRGGIDAEFHAQGFAGGARALDLRAQLLLADDFVGAAAQGGHLVVGGAKLCVVRGH